MTRMELATTAGFAQLHRMDLGFTAVPVDYPQVDSLDFRPATMRSLFEYGARCAAQGRLWATVGQAIARADKALADWQQPVTRSNVQQTPQCPLDQSQITAGAPMPRMSDDALELSDTSGAGMLVAK